MIAGPPTPWHLLTMRADLYRPSSSIGAGGKPALEYASATYANVPCRIEASSSSEDAALMRERGVRSVVCYLPAEFPPGTPISVGASWRVHAGGAWYVVVGPSESPAGCDTLRVVRMEEYTE